MFWKIKNNNNFICDLESGSLTYDVLHTVISESMDESGMKFDPNDLQDLVRALWDDAGIKDVDSEMSFEAFKRQLDKNPDLTRGLADR